jgi:hypothetical protein
MQIETESDTPFCTFDTDKQVSMFTAVDTHDLDDRDMKIFEDLADLFERRFKAKAQSLKDD